MLHKKKHPAFPTTILITVIVAFLFCLFSSTSTAYAQIVSTDTIADESDFETTVTSSSIYYNEVYYDDDNVEITLNSNFVLSGAKIRTKNDVASGAEVTYGSESNPVATIYVTGAGYTGDGTLFDVEIKITEVEIINRASSAASMIVLDFLDEDGNGDLVNYPLSKANGLLPAS